MGAYIAAVDYALPVRQVTNSELAQLHPQWQMEQVVLRTGVRTRYWCDVNETALDLAEKACRKMAERCEFNLNQIDAILFCTQSPDYPMPPNACLLQHRLELPKTIVAFDYSLACSGCVYGLFLAKALIESGAAQHVLLVMAETYSKWFHPDDRGPATLFGDGAAAMIIAAGQPAIGEFLLATNGTNAQCFYVPAGGARQPRSAESIQPVTDHNGNVRTAENLYMNGAAVLDFVKREVPALVTDLLKQADLNLNALDLIVFHQASQVTLDYLHRKLRIPDPQQFSNIAHVGNTVSASIPIALRDAEAQKVLRPGMRVMLVGFGVGLSWGGCILNWL